MTIPDARDERKPAAVIDPDLEDATLLREQPCSSMGGWIVR
jgi:hypothetical protein